MPNQRDPNKAFLGGYFPRKIVRRFHTESLAAGYTTHVECLNRLIEDFLRSRTGLPTPPNGAKRTRRQPTSKPTTP